MKLSYFFKHILPDFCWQTLHEVHTMSEYADMRFFDGLTYNHVAVILNRYVKQGIIETKPIVYDVWRTDGCKGKLYKRRTI